jgi:uncharacterized protein YcbK (DUF882 family)
MPDTKVSDNFTLYEFCRTSHPQYWEDNYKLAVENVGKITLLAQALELTRKRFASPVVITCGVRCKGLNNLVGGTDNSQHLKAEAVDFVMPAADLAEVFEWIVKHSGLKYGQVIYETKGKSIWVHYSLGEPYREAARCMMALVYNGGKYERYA